MTYSEVCEELAEWLNIGTKGKIQLASKDIFELDPQGQLFHIYDLYEYKQRGCTPQEVLVSDPYIARIVLTKLGRI